MYNTRLERVAESKLFDLVGILIILTTVGVMGYYRTPLSASWLFKGQQGWWYQLPLIGIVSTCSSIASVMSTRLVAKVNNIGNLVGWINTIFSGLIDFLLGNVGAIITYPVSVYLNWKAGQNWAKKYQDGFGHHKRFGIFLVCLILVAFTAGFGLNWIAYVWLAHWPLNLLYYFASVTFSLSLVANVLNVLKLPSQWSFWAIYNLAQLGKTISLRNWANVAKYVYYIINSVMAGVSWISQKHLQARVDEKSKLAS
ncbi:nicotinamide mononucleotide transporter [Convivina praedatoris]|uniref:Nicotinamide mononucleotide transporter n=1 Tax=Convivina praedatoris TaxID=2880963 RepID=A0ABM9D3M2_9LACO|nr:nicotinamide mononucleotide transporter [Convivina sp. LMG 32447]CAH1854610.1 hypothetical protein R078138_00916 [Convivina sp. LMG 32447]CAH1857054.1 hypothetical protein R077815_01537 [Convivina sp. LMG 32447]CAH1857482.1 hypothetical protein LMG032447_01569 [Convivina sp. LMG 32447]